MGKSDPYLFDFYNRNIKQEGEIALLGFPHHTHLFQRGDCYDKSLYDDNYHNWDINSDWSLPKKYDTIISLRCPYFAKDPETFFLKCIDSLNDGGRFYLDWGLGDHWRFNTYKIGWVKYGEHEWAYSKDNLLWSCVWHHSMANDPEVKKFYSTVCSLGYGYSVDMVYHIMQEVPSVFFIDKYVEKYNIKMHNLALWPEAPQLYTLVCGEKK